VNAVAVGSDSCPPVLSPKKTEPPKSTTKTTNPPARFISSSESHAEGKGYVTRTGTLVACFDDSVDLNDEEQKVASATRDIAATPEEIFELIADPSQQPRWDGNENLLEATPWGSALAESPFRWRNAGSQCISLAAAARRDQPFLMTQP